MTIMQNKCTVSFNGAIIIFLVSILLGAMHNVRYDGTQVKLEFIGEIDNSPIGLFLTFVLFHFCSILPLLLLLLFFFIVGCSLSILFGLHRFIVSHSFSKYIELNRNSTPAQRRIMYR